MMPDTKALYDSNLTEMCLFLDFDGTLVSLAPTPDTIEVPTLLPGILAKLHDQLSGRLYLVSGREISALEHFLPEFPGDMFGAHGAESRRSGLYKKHPLVGSQPVWDVHESAKKVVAAIPRTTLETKDTGAVIHYRAVPDAAGAVRKAAHRIAKSVVGMELHTSKMAFEIRPDDVSKANAVQQILHTQPSDLYPVVIGDDTTDEEAMAVANNAGGFSVRVGDGETCAAYRLSDPAAVIALLEHWIEKSPA